MLNKYQNNLELILNRDRSNQTIAVHQYTTYPLRLSPIFRLDGMDTNRAYLYSMNTSPGLLAKDKLNIFLQLGDNTNLYLTDQAATKIHPTLNKNDQAIVNYQIELQSQAILELVPEPIILYNDAALSQNTSIKLEANANLFLTEVILPGRLARGEFYQFRYYFNRLTVTDFTGKLLFADAMHLEGKLNPFKDSQLFAPLPIMGNAIAVYPSIDLKSLSTQLEDIQVDHHPELMVATSILPGNHGLIIRAFANKTIQIKQYFHSALKFIRSLTNQPNLPYIRK